MNRSFKQIHTSSRESGASLIELMIAMVLALLVLGAVIQIFVGSKATYNSNEALARIQENGRFSMELLKRELRDAGTHGFCAARMTIRNHLNTCGDYQDAIFDPNRALMGWEFDGTGRGDAPPALEESDLVPPTGGATNWTMNDDGTALDLPNILQGEVSRFSDVIVVRSAEVIPGVTAAGPTSSTSSTIALGAGSGLNANDVALISNCTTGADLFQNQSGTGASELSAGGGSCSAPGPGNQGGLDWSTSYDDSMQVFRMSVHAYYVGYDEDREEPGLYRADLTEGTNSPPTEELVSGVETMQVLYGYSLPADEGGDGQTVNFWLTADEVPSWEFVIGARLSFLLRSPEGLGDGDVQQTFDLASTAFTHPSDSRLRQPFFASISLRNRQIVL